MFWGEGGKVDIVSFCRFERCLCILWHSVTACNQAESGWKEGKPMEITRKTSIYTKVKCRSYSFADLTGFTELLNDCRVTHDSEESSAKRRIRFANPRKASFNQVQQFHTISTQYVISITSTSIVFAQESQEPHKEAVRSACGVEFLKPPLVVLEFVSLNLGPQKA